jgi:hypothetical protein
VFNYSCDGDYYLAYCKSQSAPPAVITDRPDTINVKAACGEQILLLRTLELLRCKRQEIRLPSQRSNQNSPIMIRRMCGHTYDGSSSYAVLAYNTIASNALPPIIRNPDQTTKTSPDILAPLTDAAAPMLADADADSVVPGVLTVVAPP